MDKSDLTGAFESVKGALWAQDQGLNHQQKTEETAKNLSRNQEKGAEEVSQMARNLQKQDAKGKALQESKEKTKDTFYLIRTIQQIKEDLDRRINQMQDYIDQMKENDRLIHEGVKLLKDDNIDGMKLYLLNEFDIDAGALSDDEIREKVRDKVGDRIENQAELKAKIEKLAQECQNELDELDPNNPEHAGVIADYSEKLTDLQEEASKYDHLQYEKALKEVHLESDKDLKLLASHRDSNDKSERNPYIDTDSSVNDESGLKFIVDSDVPESLARMQDVAKNSFAKAATPDQNKPEITNDAANNTDFEDGLDFDTDDFTPPNGDKPPGPGQ